MLKAVGISDEERRAIVASQFLAIQERKVKARQQKNLETVDGAVAAFASPKLIAALKAPF